MKRFVYIALGVAVLVVGGFMVSQALSGSLVYFIVPSEYAQDPDRYRGQPLRLGGIVEAGSVNYDRQDQKLTFTISDSIDSFPVVYAGSPPQLFQENNGVVVEGRFQDDTFVSDRVLIKHSENYEAPASGEPIDIEALKDFLE